MAKPPVGGLSRESAEPGAILLGNGLNRISLGPSWEDLLVSLAEAARLPRRGYQLDLEKPFPLLYEELVLRSDVDRGEIEALFRDKVLEFSGELTPHPLHETALKLKVHHYLTTNYDFTLERAGTEEPPVIRNAGTAREKRYSLFRRYDLREKHFWHIHGDIEHPASIMLGYDHYAGALERIRRYTTSRVGYGQNRKEVVRRLRHGLKTVDSWLDLFFITDVHIIGLALDLVEMHLWWVLTCRARMLAENAPIEGGVYFYVPRVTGIRRPRHEERKLELLDALGAEVVELEVRRGKWEEFYKEALKRV